MRKIKTSVAGNRGTLRQKAGAILQKRGARKELEAFHSVVGMWENKDTSFFDKK